MSQIDFNKEVLKQKGLVLVKFSAEWCGPCKALTPVLKSISEEFSVPIVEIDGNKEPDLIKQFGIRNVPTTILFKDGIKVEQMIGASTRSTIVETLITPYL